MNIKNIRRCFPQVIQNQKNIYLDNASTTFKLSAVIDRIVEFYKNEVSNVHRGAHRLSSRATTLYEKARENTAQFISARHTQEIVFTRSTTEGLNFLADTLKDRLNEGDEIVITEMEHHSNYLPWMRIAQKNNLKIKFIPVAKTGELDLSNLSQIINSKTKITALVHQSNALGTVNDISRVIQQAQSVGAVSIIDAAQSVSSMKINVQNLNCDFLLFSAHKLFSPSGVGVIYGKKNAWSLLEPYQLGGGMVDNALKRIWADPPHCFEAGTPAVEGVLGLSSGIEFIQNHFNFEEIQKHEKELLEAAEESLKKIPGLRIVGASPSRINTLSFIVENIHSDDIGQLIGAQNIAVRSGHHCCQPLMEKYRLPSGTVRISFSVYNTKDDILALEKSMQKTIQILSK